MDLDLWFELLADPAYQHVLLNHLPLTGLAVSGGVLLWATIEDRWRSIVFALALVVVSAGAVIPVMEVGEAAYPFVFDRLDGTGRAWLDHHTELADRWGFLVVIDALAAGLAIALGHFRPPLRRAAAIGVLVLTLVALGTAAVIAEAGGLIRHEEFRLSDPPAASPR